MINDDPLTLNCPVFAPFNVLILYIPSVMILMDIVAFRQLLHVDELHLYVADIWVGWGVGGGRR